MSHWKTNAGTFQHIGTVLSFKALVVKHVTSDDLYSQVSIILDARSSPHLPLQSSLVIFNQNT